METSIGAPGVGETGYEIVRASLASGPFKTVSSVEGNVWTSLDTEAKPEVIYFCKVRAIGKEGPPLFPDPYRPRFPACGDNSTLLEFSDRFIGSSPLFL